MREGCRVQWGFAVAWEAFDVTQYEVMEIVGRQGRWKPVGVERLSRPFIFSKDYVFFTAIFARGSTYFREMVDFVDIVRFLMTCAFSTWST